MDDTLRVAYPAELAGVDVEGADGAFVGRVRDVYLVDATGALRALTVTRGRFSTRTVLVPVSAVDHATVQAVAAASAEPPADASSEAHREHSAPLRLRVAAAVVRDRGVAPDPTGHADPELLARAAAALVPEGASAG